LTRWVRAAQAFTQLTGILGAGVLSLEDRVATVVLTA
jgi:hypothetical protein